MLIIPIWVWYKLGNFEEIICFSPYMIDTLNFFYKNKVYKNVEPQICQNLKNILDAEIVNILLLFLSPIIEAQNSFFVRKVNIF